MKTRKGIINALKKAGLLIATLSCLNGNAWSDQTQLPPSLQVVGTKWYENEQMLKELVSLGDIGIVKGIKFIKEEKTPVDGLTALIYEASVEQEGEIVKERLVLYTDANRQHVVIGSIFDIKKGRDVADLIGATKIIENVSFSELQPFELKKSRNGKTITVMLDLGYPAGRSFYNTLKRYADKTSTGVKVALVSDAKNENNVGGQALLMGSYGTPRFEPWMNEWLDKGAQASFMDKEKLRSDPIVKNILGQGIFKIDVNSAEAYKYGFDRLPAVFVTEKGKTVLAAVPKTEAEWKRLFAD